MLNYKYKLIFFGERGQVVKAAGCGSAIRRFKSGRSPVFY